MYEIFAKLLEERGVTAYKVSKETGVGTATLTSWKQGKYNPKPDKMKKIAEYFGVTVTKGSGDYGADIIATNTQSGLKYAIQCKCYSSNIGNKAVQEIVTGKQMYKCDMAAVLTNQFYTQSAIDTAKVTGVQLWDRKILLKFLQQYKSVH